MIISVEHACTGMGVSNGVRRSLANVAGATSEAKEKYAGLPLIEPVTINDSSLLTLSFHFYTNTHPPTQLLIYVSCFLLHISRSRSTATQTVATAALAPSDLGVKRATKEERDDGRSPYHNEKKMDQLICRWKGR